MGGDEADAARERGIRFIVVAVAIWVDGAYGFYGRYNVGANPLLVAPSFIEIKTRGLPIFVQIDKTVYLLAL